MTAHLRRSVKEREDCSAAMEDGHAVAALAAGFTHHLVKPVDIDALLQLIATSSKKVT